MGSLEVDDSNDSRRNITMQPVFFSKLLSGLDLRVFYVRVSNFEAGHSTPENLTLNYFPLTPDAIVEVNGRKSCLHSECVSLVLRRDRFDMRFEEATFVSTDSIRITGSVKFEVYSRFDLLLSGVLELSNGNGFLGESKSHSRKWSMKCRSGIAASTNFVGNKQYGNSEFPLPTIDVYVTGSYSGVPIILTKTIQVCLPKKYHSKPLLNSIPEFETSETEDAEKPEEPDYQVYKEDEMDTGYHGMHNVTHYLEEDGELTWFNAGVRVGVGIGLGVCVGVGVGFGLLVRTFQATTKTFKRRLI